MSIAVVAWVLEHSETRLGDRLVLIALADYAHDDGTEAFPSVDTIARKARLSERQVQRALRTLERNGDIVFMGTSKLDTRKYTIVCERGDNLSPGGDKSGSEGGDNLSPDPCPVLDPSYIGVKEAWMAHAGPAPKLIPHRETHWTTPTVRRLIKRKIAMYGERDVINAIANYAAVLASDRHFFSYRWGIADFLNRGIDRFLPEADPDTNYLIKRQQEEREPDYPMLPDRP